jgi:hypothetical protein
MEREDFAGKLWNYSAQLFESNKSMDLPPSIHTQKISKKQVFIQTSIIHIIVNIHRK